MNPLTVLAVELAANNPVPAEFNISPLFRKPDTASPVEPKDLLEIIDLFDESKRYRYGVLDGSETTVNREDPSVAQAREEQVVAMPDVGLLS